MENFTLVFGIVALIFVVLLIGIGTAITRVAMAVEKIIGIEVLEDEDD